METPEASATMLRQPGTLPGSAAPTPWLRHATAGRARRMTLAEVLLAALGALAALSMLRGCQ